MRNFASLLLFLSPVSSFIASSIKCAIPTCLQAEKAIGEMRVAELRDELKERNVDFSDCFDKESLCTRLEDARKGAIGGSTSVKDQFSRVKANEKQAKNQPEKLIDKAELLQEIRNMTVKALREDLASKSIRWAGLLEKEDLVQAVLKARLEALNFSATGRLVPGQVVEIAGKDLIKEIDKPDVPLLLDVFATWCGPCKLVAPQLQAVAARMGKNLRVCKMDSDKEQEASAKLRIQGLPTLILFNGGKEVSRMEGALMEPQILAWIEKELPTAM